MRSAREARRARSAHTRARDVRTRGEAPYAMKRVMFTPSPMLMMPPRFSICFHFRPADRLR
jgi:hypothetical protein